MFATNLEKIQKLIKTRKEVRYLIAGTASEAIEYISFLILMSATNLLYFSNSISFILGVISGFIFHKTWTFKGEHQFKTRQQFIGYISLAAINFVAINIFIGFYAHRLHLVASIAKLLAIVTTVVWTYLITNLFIFKYKSPDS